MKRLSMVIASAAACGVWTGDLVGQTPAQVVGTYQTSVAVVEQTCQLMVQDNPTIVAVGDQPNVILLTHAGTTYGGLLRNDGSFHMQPRSVTVQEQAYHLDVSGQFTSDTLHARVVIRWGANPECRVVVTWRGPRGAASAVADTTLRDELLQMMAKDQEARKRLEAMMADTTADPMAMARLVDEAAAIDSVHTARVRDILATIGWPATSRVGRQAAQAMWLLVQHADAQPGFQREALVHLERAVAAGEASGTNLAYLTDRVLLAEGKPQQFGTQLTRREGRWQPRPIADSAGVDERRRSVGLGPLAEYVLRQNSP